MQAISGMPVEHAEERNMVFPRTASRSHRFPMRKTTEPIIAARRHVPEAQLAGEWQNGLETLSGVRQRKLRLVLAPQIKARTGSFFNTRS